ncbi:MAG: SdrD B-like domain-containing protein, partial [Acidobacteriota bacterium]
INAQRFRVTANVGDLAFRDVDSDGVQSAGDPGVPGVVVRLFEGSIGLLDETTTDADGRFLFRPKIGSRGAVDQFYLEFESTDSSPFTLPGAGNDDALDSDADPISGVTEPFLVISAGDSRLDLDVGLLEAGTLIFVDGFESGDTSKWTREVQ